MKLGFIGCGNMASAIIFGILEKGLVKREDIFASTKSESSAKRVTEALGISCSTDNLSVAKEADYLFLCVKSQFCADTAIEIRDFLYYGAGVGFCYCRKKTGLAAGTIRCR